MSVFKIYQGKRIGPKNKNWKNGRWYVYKRINGKVIHKSIPEAQTKEQAEIAERRILDEVFNKKYGVGSQETFKAFVDRVYRKYVQQNNVNVAAKDLYIRLLGEVFDRRSVLDITPQDCRNVQATFRKRYSASTVNLIMSTASKIFTLACQEGILDKNPMQYVTRLKEPPPRDRLLSKEEWERLWKVLEKDVLLFRLVTIAVNLPLRRGQILAITPDAIDLVNGLLYVKESKGRAARAVPLNNIAADTFRRMISDYQLPFPLKETGIQKRWRKALVSAGINGKHDENKFRFHDLRKEFATNLRKKGTHSKTIQDLFAHSSMRITDVYLPPEFEAMREAVNSLDEKVIDGGIQ